jgi:hypothetical protein
MSNGWTPTTDSVRAVYAQWNDDYFEFIDPDHGEQFDRWLAKHDEKVARDAVNAERLRVLGLLENAERMQNLYRTVWWGQSSHPSGTRAARLMTDLLRAELMGEDDE